ncbi:MAG: DUF2087 domain-containing protein [Chloroflexi bacterium]|nr:DUF2087 domain-containing protein [Chloroflexota bacterium]MDA1002560.1 DUF2087 domain-containing protein [Chloroflexota bacterium]
MRAPRPSDAPDDPVRALRRRAHVLDRLLDGSGRVTRWPKRRTERQMILDYLIEFVPRGEVFNERQVTDLLASLHTFRDPPLLRRQLIDTGLLERRTDGSAYWRPGGDG